MEPKSKNKQGKGLRVNEEGTELYVEHEGKDLTFIYPAKGPGKFTPEGPREFAQVGEQIDAAGLVRPTMAQTASLVYAAWQNPNGEYSRKVLEEMETIEGKWLWAFTGALFVPKKGVYIQDHPKTVNGRISMDQSELEKMIKEGNPNVRFTPYGYETAYLSSPEDLETNSFVQALAGREGAEKLAYVAKQYKEAGGQSDPLLVCYDRVNSLVSELATLSSQWTGHRKRLMVFSMDTPYSTADKPTFGGTAFGVKKE